MSKSSLCIPALLALLLAGAPARSAVLSANQNAPDPFMGKHLPKREVDRGALREAVDETQALFDALARETRRRDRSLLKELPHELRMDYRLPQAEDRARKCLVLSEEVVSLQEGIKAQQQALIDAAVPDKDKEEQKLLGLQSDLMSAVEDLRGILRGLHTDLKEDQVRDLHNWLMVSQGLLRRQREDAEARAAADASATAETQPLSAEGLTPPAAASAEPLTPTAVPADAP